MRVQEIAKRRGIRYWIVDGDESVMPDEYHKGVQRLTDASGIADNRSKL